MYIDVFFYLFVSNGFYFIRGWMCYIIGSCYVFFVGLYEGDGDIYKYVFVNRFLYLFVC